jgi:amino-acid N-acetyltransferase
MKYSFDPPLSTVRRLLEQSHLPTADLTSELMRHFLVSGAADDPTGVVGLEIFGPIALLRSLAVAAERRQAGLGTALVAAAENHARTCDVREIFLLTTTAAQFFERLGYLHAERAAAPACIRDSSQFATLCPGSAVLMHKRLPVAA